MQKSTVESAHLYQSLWWTRLAAFSEKRESPAPANTRQTEKKRSSFRKTLASLFGGMHLNQERGHASFLTLNGIKY